jgi:hypothetical protein
MDGMEMTRKEEVGANKKMMAGTEAKMVEVGKTTKVAFTVFFEINALAIQ